MDYLGRDLLPPPRSSTPAPHKGDQLFRSDAPNASTASINQNISAYTEGYRRGAEQLVQHVLSDGAELNFLVYPIIFLYRHHLELALKRILHRTPQLLGRNRTKKENERLWRGHNLDALWGDLRPLLNEVYSAMAWTEPEAADVEGIDDCMGQLSKVDPQSYSFRYPFSTSGDPVLENLKSVDLRHFAEVIGRLIHYIDDIDTATSLFAEFNDEMEAEYAYEADRAEFDDY